MSAVLSLIALSVLLFCVLLMVPAKDLAKFIKQQGPVLLAGVGVLLIFARQMALGTFALVVAMNMWRRNQNVRQTSPHAGGGRRSSVRSASLDMELDHDNGNMDGVILAGTYEGKKLSDLDEAELLALRKEIAADSESISLLDAYLDRRFSAWRENADADASAGEAGPTSSGAMSEEEAYQVLGLSPGASVDEIRLAHRRMMKTAHPDSGGSTFLASKINEAKDVLLRSHS